MNFPTQTLLMPVGPHFSVLDDSLIKGYYAKILSHIRKEFFPDEKDRVVKMELFRKISKHSAVFQINSLIEIEGVEDEGCLVPRRAKFFILNFSPKDHKFQIIQFYEIEGLLFDKILAKSPKDKTEKSFLEGICPANDNFDDCPKLINYFIFYNISLFKKDERAIVSFGQVFCFDGYASDQYFKKGVELMGFSPEDYGWYFPTKAEISFGN